MGILCTFGFAADFAGSLASSLDLLKESGTGSGSLTDEAFGGRPVVTHCRLTGVPIVLGGGGPNIRDFAFDGTGLVLVLLSNSRICFCVEGAGPWQFPRRRLEDAEKPRLEEVRKLVAIKLLEQASHNQ